MRHLPVVLPTWLIFVQITAVRAAEVDIVAILGILGRSLCNVLDEVECWDLL